MTISNSITVTEEQAKMLVYGNIPDDFNCEIIEEGEWKGRRKYQSKQTVFKQDGKTYMVGATRTGSHYTDYHVEYQTKCYLVMQVTTVEWVRA